MSLTTAQKHDLMIQFNDHREEVYNGYLDEKVVRKEEEVKSGTKKPDMSQSEFKKLYKQLGTNNKNKDVRRQFQDEVNMYTDNQLSTNMNGNVTSGYTMDKHN